MANWTRHWSAAALAGGLAVFWAGCSDEEQVVGLAAAGADGVASDSTASADSNDLDGAAGPDGSAVPDGAPQDSSPGDGAVAADGASGDAVPVDEVGDGGADPDAEVAVLPDVPAPVCPGQPGCDCSTDADCSADSACLDTAEGSRCAAPCLSGVACAPGTQCAAIAAGDPSSTTDDKALCVPKWPTLCDPCLSSSTCAAQSATAAACVGLGTPAGAVGWFCGVSCKSDDQCPAGYGCLEGSSVEGDAGAWCMPKSGICACSASASAKALQTTCATKVQLPAGAAVCVGTRGCGASGLTACGAPTATTETCDGQDNDCDGATDEGATCDDGNGCTADSCQAGACVFLPTVASCTDANACTNQDTCGGGNCAGTPLTCDDKNVCTIDSCDAKLGCVYAPNSAPCEDGNACTGSDACAAGVCVGQPGQCPCSADADCKDKNDANLCNGVLYCDKSGVAPTCKVNPASIVVCDPKEDTFCAVAACESATGKCQLKGQNLGKACSDGTACTLQDSCVNGKCSGTALLCDDANACTDDACDPAVGCTHKANVAPCSDGDACTLGDTCAVGACKVTPKVCDDGYACSIDSCDKGTGACAFVLPQDATCAVQPAPYIDGFACDATATAAQWHRSGGDLAAGAVRWAFDASPALPQGSTTGCSLNINNGKDLACGGGQSAIDQTADSPWVDLTKLPPAQPLLVRFASTGSWTAQHSATVSVRAPGGAWALVGTVAPAASNTWSTIALPVKAFAGSKLQVRLRLSGPCAAGQTGWFVDELSVSADTCAVLPLPCKANETCAVAANTAAICTPCKPGLQVVANQCADIDECAAAGTCSASATCSNSVGSFTCTCLTGFAGDGKTCTDIDECATAKDDCDKTAVCVNKPGTFQCACPKDQVGDGKACYKKGSNAKAPAASCLEILTLYPGTADGSYWLDVDGVGAAPSTSYYCDMKSGGWTLLIFDDFEDGTTKGWSAGKVSGCGKYGKILGGPDVFGKGAAPAKTVAAPIHTQAKLGLKYIRVDSWDGEHAVVQVNGNAVFDQKGTAGLFGNECGKWNWDEDHWDVAWTGAHTAAQATVTVTSSLDQGADDEAFAFDNAVLWVR